MDGISYILFYDIGCFKKNDCQCRWDFIYSNVLRFVESRAEVITSRTKQKYIIEFTHSGSNNENIDYIATIQGGHLGINKTTEKISSRYYWPNIKEDVTSFIHTCDKSTLMKTHVELHPISIATKIFSQVGIDLMSLTESEGFDEDGGYKYLSVHNAISQNMLSWGL